MMFDHPLVGATVVLAVTILLAMVLRRIWPIQYPSFDDERTSERRLGRYKMLLSAISEIQAERHKSRGWQRLTSAVHAVSLVAPAEVVEVVVRIHDELRSTRSLSPESSRLLIKTLRKDIEALGPAAELESYHVVPLRPSAQSFDDDRSRP